jgi:hypothetical protein
MSEVCQDCGTAISTRARANVWNGERVVCSPCLRRRKERIELEARLPAIRAAMVGWPDRLWLVHDRQHQSGPYTTEQLIELLRTRRVDWGWHIWREGMTAWKAPAQLFTMPELAKDGQIRLREFCRLNDKESDVS